MSTPEWAPGTFRKTSDDFKKHSKDVRFFSSISIIFTHTNTTKYLQAFVTRSPNKTLQRGTDAIVYNNSTVPKPTSKDYATHPKEAYVKRAVNKTLQRGTNAIIYDQSSSIPIPTSRDYTKHSKEAHVKRAPNHTLKRGTDAITYHYTSKE